MDCLSGSDLSLVKTDLERSRLPGGGRIRVELNERVNRPYLRLPHWLSQQQVARGASSSLSSVLVNHPQQFVIHSLSFLSGSRTNGMSSTVSQVIAHQSSGDRSQRLLC